MNFLKFLLGGKKHSTASEPGLEEHRSVLDSLRKPAIRLTASTDNSRSHIGGMPLLPEDMAWPEWKGKPLSFVCQLDLSEIPAASACDVLPPSGMLLFFYNQEQDTWGFDFRDKESWRVIYLPSDRIATKVRAAPKGLSKNHVFTQKIVKLTPAATYPDSMDERVEALHLTDIQLDEYSELCASVFEGAPMHHLLGYPTPIQGNDMDLECQLVTNGLYCGDQTGYNDPRAKQLEGGRSDWQLLLQLDSDDDVGMMWGDGGMLYFWIRGSDLQAKRFENCWMILQCS